MTDMATSSFQEVWRPERTEQPSTILLVKRATVQNPVHAGFAARCPSFSLYDLELNTEPQIRSPPRWVSEILFVHFKRCILLKDHMQLRPPLSFRQTFSSHTLTQVLEQFKILLGLVFPDPSLRVTGVTSTSGATHCDGRRKKVHQNICCYRQKPHYWDKPAFSIRLTEFKALPCLWRQQNERPPVHRLFPHTQKHMHTPPVSLSYSQGISFCPWESEPDTSLWLDPHHSICLAKPPYYLQGLNYAWECVWEREIIGGPVSRLLHDQPVYLALLGFLSCINVISFVCIYICVQQRVLLMRSAWLIDRWIEDYESP